MTSGREVGSKTPGQTVFRFGERAYEVLLDPADRFLIWDVKADRPIVLERDQFSYETFSDARRAIERLCRSSDA